MKYIKKFNESVSAKKILNDLKDGKRRTILTKEERDLLIDYGIWWLKYGYTNIRYSDHGHIQAMGYCPGCKKYTYLSTQEGNVKLVPKCFHCVVKNRS